MYKIAILTATYNRSNELLRLFESLKLQNNKDFSWLIVNDGSNDDTEETLRLISQSDAVNVDIINKKNGGKSSAINLGFDCLEHNADFILIVDDDEILEPYAIETVKRYLDKYANTDCGVIHFNRKDEKGNVIANHIFDKDCFMNFQLFKSNGYFADGYLGYFTNKLKNRRFSIYSGEKYIAPSTLIMKVTIDSNLLWAKAILGKTEYLEGGITKQGRMLRLKNPQGMIEYCEGMQKNGASFKTRLVYSIQGYAYESFCRKKDKSSQFIKIAMIPGRVLSAFWKMKYLK